MTWCEVIEIPHLKVVGFGWFWLLVKHGDYFTISRCLFALWLCATKRLHRSLEKLDHIITAGISIIAVDIWWYNLKITQLKRNIIFQISFFGCIWFINLWGPVWVLFNLQKKMAVPEWKTWTVCVILDIGWTPVKNTRVLIRNDVQNYRDIGAVFDIVSNMPVQRLCVGNLSKGMAFCNPYISG